MWRPLLLSLLLCSPAAAQTARQMGEAERARAALLAAQRDATSRAEAAQAEERRLGNERVLSAAAMRDAETEAADLAAAIEQLAVRKRDAEARLQERAATLAPLLPLMERLALYPAETLLAVPVPPAEALRGLMVLRGLARQLEADAAALRAEQAEVAAAARELDAALPRLRITQARQAVQAAALDRQMDAARAGRVDAQDAATDAARRAAIEATRAETLRAAIAGIEAERARAEARAEADAARADRQREAAAAADARRRQEALARPAGPGLVEPRPARSGVITAAVSPVAGTVVRGWGDRTEAGPANGVSYRAPPLARVVAPCAGRVAFAGPFRTFGLLLILDCGGGYHFVLAGFERVDVAVGASVQRAEPVGVMPGWDPQASGARPALYVELRRNGQAVNPAPFLRARG